MSISPKSNALITIRKNVSMRSGRITVLNDKNEGASISIGDEDVVPVGRSYKKCDIVINSDKISRIHCLIEYSGIDQAYIVTDISTNGVYLQNNRLPKNIPVLVPAGTILELADKTYRLSLE